MTFGTTLVILLVRLKGTDREIKRIRKPERSDVDEALIM